MGIRLALSVALSAVLLISSFESGNTSASHGYTRSRSKSVLRGQRQQRNLQGSNDEATSECGNMRVCENRTALDDYVARPDDSYNWYDTGFRIQGRVDARYGGGEWTGIVLNMTSQRWLNASVTSCSLWWHYLLLVVPRRMPNASRGTALLLLAAGRNSGTLWGGGGNADGAADADAEGEDNRVWTVGAGGGGGSGGGAGNGSEAETGTDGTGDGDGTGPGTAEPEGAGPKIVDAGLLPQASDSFVIIAASLAVQAGTLGAVLFQVPNQPCNFRTNGSADASSVSEDPLVAATWRQFLLNPSDSDWPATLPMAKAAVRAMDAVQEAVPVFFPSLAVHRFAVAGVSKRGLAAWAVAAVDKRVVALMPVGAGAINFVSSLKHYYQSLGGWPITFKPYVLNDVTRNMLKPNMQKLVAIIDPYTYRRRYSMPKLLLFGANDEFFMIDDTYYFYWDMPDPKFLRIMPNQEHMLLQNNPEVILSGIPFYTSIVLSTALPPSPPPPSLSSSSSSSSPSSPPSPPLAAAASTAETAAAAAASTGRPLSVRSRGSQPDWPQLTWLLDRHGAAVEGTTDRRPSKIRAWYSRSPRRFVRRDFRWIVGGASATCFLKVTQVPLLGDLCPQAVLFQPVPVRPSYSALDRLWHFRARITNFPKVGYKAIFVEVEFPPLRPSGNNITLTTEALVVPNSFPFSYCTGPKCDTRLV
ncbi:hypothetical protein CLOP_g5199 [Closterium sp. NIES-67]|nr:hypothetical protein CLOP_g5199 [Closterium sp. NIES-67]